MTHQKELAIYQAKTGAIELSIDPSRQTFWATQAQIAQIFGTTPQNITLHIQNVYKEGELSSSSTCKESLQVQKEGKRTIRRRQKIYNLDVIISVGYRISSLSGTKFRQWATKMLRAHIVDGYTVNKKRLSNNYDAFLQAVEQVKTLLPPSGAVDAGSAMELVKMFANTWFSLDAYDKERFPKKGFTKKKIQIAADELQKDIVGLKKDLMKRGEATQLFASGRREEGIEGIVGAVFQTFGGKDLYPSIEGKAAHLLYFMVKNHPFVDGNKRSGAFAFVWFLKRAGILNPARITAEALTAITLLVAESPPKEKEKMVGVIMLLLR